MPRWNRRQFHTWAASGALALPAWQSRQVYGANERVRLGFIGVGNRGDQVLAAFLSQKDSEVVGICDIYAPYRELAARKVGGSPALYHDYRKMLEDKSIDAVVICTPDHWHALQTIHACQAGKDVYVEKPLSLTVVEGRKMVQAARQHRRVVQVGIQRMSSALGREVTEVIRSGGIGQVTVVRAFHIQNEWPKGIGKPADGSPPPDVDWDAWLGPAPAKPYNKNRTFYRFRWFYDYSGGQLTNFGVHYLASIHWALGLQAPKAAVALGGKFANYDNREVPDTLEVLWHYPGDILVTFSQYNANGAPAAARPCEIEFRGTLGTLYLNTSGYEIVPEVITEQEFPARTPLDRSLERRYRADAKPHIEPRKVTGRILDADHARNFLDCVKSRKEPSCPIEFGHAVTTAALIANIAHRTKSYLEWDAQSERFTNNEAANRWLHYEYRPPYRLPG
ncbi:MAG: Gfo/Idh/MocA family oxidoreductase [Gemmataceae bacterium]|nr:Gfo/Idh/MocA family oxidoreductase [Gemmataceae bacterium]